MTDTNNTDGAALLPVTAEDREAASTLIAWHNKVASEWKVDGGNDLTFFAADMPDGIRRGIWDEHDVVQAFARHRALGQCEVPEGFLCIHEFLASLSTPTAEPMGDETLRAALATIQAMIGNVDHSRGHGPNAAEMRGGMLNDIRDLCNRALTTPPTPDRIGKDAVREAVNRIVGELLGALMPDVQERIAVGNRACDEILAALSATPAQPVDETERLHDLLHESLYHLRLDDGAKAFHEKVMALRKARRPQHKGEVSRG